MWMSVGVLDRVCGSCTSIHPERVIHAASARAATLVRDSHDSSCALGYWFEFGRRVCLGVRLQVLHNSRTLVPDIESCFG